MTRALEDEVADGDMPPRQAMDVAIMPMRGNQLTCFDIKGRRGALREAPSTPDLLPWPYRFDDDGPAPEAE